MIFKKEQKGRITIYYLKKDVDDETAKKFHNTFVKPSQIHHIIKEDADVYDYDSGELLIKFRKGVLKQENIDIFYENIAEFANKISTNRGNASNTNKKKKKAVGINPGVKSNIFGYFDSFSISQKAIFKRKGIKAPLNVRECVFNRDYPEKYQKTIPLIEEIDAQYKKLTPEHYEKQFSKAKQTHFKITNTAFTTVTTNVNFRTAVHLDKGDDPEGFGNLAIIEKGSPYKGGETCFPQYGIGVDARMGDIVFMNVHYLHGNLPIEGPKDIVRLSIVCYLRTGIWEKTKGKTKKFMEYHNKTVKKALGK
jgi:hypothetical protein